MYAGFLPGASSNIITSVPSDLSIALEHLSIVLEHLSIVLEHLSIVLEHDICCCYFLFWMCLYARFTVIHRLYGNVIFSRKSLVCHFGVHVLDLLLESFTGLLHCVI